MAEHDYDFDLFVIGGGSGGVRAARIAAGHGAKVVLAEEYRMGGTCVIRGCVPKKFMVYASEYGRKLDEARKYGWSVGDCTFDFGTFMANMHAEVDRLSGLYMSGQVNAGVEVFEERAEFVDAHTLKLKTSGKTITADKILVAVGGTPWVPEADELPGVEHTITSDGVFQLTELPKHIVIAGGGYIACEFAHVFAGLGVETCLVYRGETVLRGFDMDVRTAVHEGLKEAGVRVITQTVFESIEKRDGERPLHLKLTNGMELDADVIMMAVGRMPYTAELGLEKAGVKTEGRGRIVVDDYSQSSVENIYAVGDVTQRAELTPVAIREGHAFADTVFGGQPRTFDHGLIATAVFTQPEVGTVGLSEADARKKYGNKIDIYKTKFRPMKNMLNGKAEKVLMKLIVRQDDDVVIGAHIVSPDAGEMIQMLGIAVKMGATKAQFDATCAVHPTIAEEIVTMRTKWEPPV